MRRDVRRARPETDSDLSQVPHPMLASCLRRACDMRATKGRRQGRPPPPTHLSPPRGCARRVGGATTGDTRQAPPPAEGQVPRLVPAPCLRRACDVRAAEGRRQGRPPPPHTHTSAPPRVGGAGRAGRKAPPPPEDKAARWGGSGERVRDGPHDRARREHAPCKPQRGDHRGCERRVGRATTGATRHAPPPPQQRDRCRASCLRRACVVPATCVQRRGGDKAPPPPPPPPHLRPIAGAPMQIQT